MNPLRTTSPPPPSLPQFLLGALPEPSLTLHTLFTYMLHAGSVIQPAAAIMRLIGHLPEPGVPQTVQSLKSARH